MQIALVRPATAAAVLAEQDQLARKPGEQRRNMREVICLGSIGAEFVLEVGT